MKPLDSEIEIQKVLDCIKETFPTMKVPPVYMFNFVEKRDRYGDASMFDEIGLSLQTLGELNCKNEQFIRTICREVVHINHWEEGHSGHFWYIYHKVFEKVNEKLKKGVCV